MGSITAHVIRRLGPLHFILGMLEAAESPVKDSGLTTEERARTEILRSRIGRCVLRAKGMEPAPGDAKEDRRVKRAILRMNDALWELWPENIDAREVVAAALSLVAAQQEELDRLWAEGHIRGPRAQAKRMEWNLLHGLLADLAEALDSELEGAPLDKGDHVGGRMAEALAGREVRA
ncbi:hypothetical protein SAMN04488503_2210 [Humidesulfovibrio mexicanus]|uniref:Uncharacterized protein n=1 Tax=Humidesulfovibrio mexicanus TaxID=147047 RepID=A0A239ATP6_9BACT|nr:hypothetical protein [Humidesulfovibrio mexicanus]SNR98899.1 hypothetical protein SAMN04488503_2210 [Humidesulfovibrio mexicanus]